MISADESPPDLLDVEDDEEEIVPATTTFSNNNPGSSSSRRASSLMSSAQQIQTRNLVAFWLLGLCNNFGYVVMLSAAKDILERSSDEPTANGTTECIKDVSQLRCSPVSTGAVLLADILPSLCVKLLAPFLLHSTPYMTRHSVVVLFQAASFLVVAYSQSIAVGLLGVVFASLGAGLGEVTYLSLSSHFHNDAISSWSSGTGGAGIFGALAFAALTDHRLLALSPKHALLSMLLVPFALALTFARLLKCPPSVHQQSMAAAAATGLSRSSSRTGGSATAGFYGTTTATTTTYSPSEEHEEVAPNDLQSLLLQRNERREEEDGGGLRKLLLTRARIIRPLLKFMVPLTVVYLSEYFINQGLLELLVFDCDHGLEFSPMQQYRWYQVLYQFGVFLSRSSVKLFPVKPAFIPLLALLQAANALFLFEESFRLHIPHLLLLMLLIFYEGLLGGSAYVNTFSAIHRRVSKANREFSLSFVAISDSMGIVLAGFLAIYAHNFICKHR